MANIYELPLPDGSIVEVEGERPPTREEWMRAIGPKLAPNPKGGLPVVSDEGLLAKAQRVARPQQAQESLAAGLQAAQGATNIVEQGARQARLEGVRQQVAAEDARNAEIRSKLAAAGQMAASVVPPLATTVALGPFALTPPGIATIMAAGTGGQMLAQRLQNRDIFEPSNLVESGVVGLVSPVGVGAMRAGSTIPQYLGQGLREGFGIGSAIEAGRGVSATMRGEEYRPDAQTAMTFGLSAGLATAGRGIEGTIANRAAQNANKLKQQGANTQATLTDMSMAQAQSGINDIEAPAVEPSPFDNYIARKAVIAAENRSDVAKERMLQQLIDDAALSEAKRDAARLGVEVDSNITERARNRVLKARQKHGDNLDAAIADITDRIEKSTPPMPEDLPPSTAGERRTTPAQDTEKFNARRISIYDDLVNQGVPADEANKAALALAGTKDSREYQLLYDRIFRVREGTTEAGAKPTKLTSLRDLTLENVGIPTPRDFEAERLQIELAAQQQEAAQAQARAAQGVEADVSAAERADAALLGGTSGEAQQTVDLVRQRIMADRMRRAVNLLQSEGLPVAAARALAGAESPQEYNYILGEVRARYGQPQAAPAPARQPVRQLRSLEELTPEAVGIEPAAPTPVRELTPAEEPQNAVQIESPAVPVLQPKGAGEGGKVELQPVEQGNVPEKAAAKAAKEEAVPDLTGIASMEEGRKLLSPAQNKEVDELQDLIYRSAARQGPETGYKPYNLTEKEIARGKELMAKYRPLWYRGADSPTLPTPAQQSPTVSTPANPSGVAAKEEVTPSVTVKRGKDFQTYGIYEAKVGDETYRIFRDKESGQWREEGVGMDDPTGMTGFLGYTKEEAINRLRDRQMKAMAAAPKKAAAPAPEVEAPKPVSAKAVTEQTVKLGDAGLTEVVGFAKSIAGSTKERQGYPKYRVIVDGKSFDLQGEKSLEKFLGSIPSNSDVRIFRNIGKGVTLDFDNPGPLTKTLEAKAAKLKSDQVNKAQNAIATEAANGFSEANAYASRFATKEEFNNSLPDAAAEKIPSNKTDEPYSGEFAEGDIVSDKYGENPYVYKNVFVDPKAFAENIKLEGKTYQEVVNMPTTQKYIEWYRQGEVPPPIDVVWNPDTKKYVSSNRRRVIAAIEAGRDRIPARVEVGRLDEIYEASRPAQRPTATEPVAAPTPESPLSGIKDAELRARAKTIDGIISREGVSPEQVNALREERSSILAELDQRKTSRKQAGKKGRGFGIGTMADGTPDLLNSIEDAGGISPPSAGSGGEYDGFSEAFGSGVARLLRNKGGSRVDQLIEELNGQGYNFRSSDDFYEAVKRAMDNRTKVRKQVDTDKATDTFQRAATMNEGRSTSEKAAAPISVDELSVGDKFKVKNEPFEVVDIDPDTGDVIVRDGERFGTQRIQSGMPLYADADSLRRIPKEEFGFLSPEDEAAAAAAPSTPTVRAGENLEMFTGGDTGGDTTFNLAGETVRDYTGFMDAKAQAEAAKAQAEVAQSKMFTDIEPAAQKEIVPAAQKEIVPVSEKEITPVKKSTKDIIRERAKALQEARRATGVEPEPAPAAQEVPEPKTSPSPLNMEERNRLAFLNKKFSSKTGLSPNEEVERAALSVRAKASGQAGNVSTAALINIASPVAGGAVGYNLVQKRDNETEEEYKARKLAAAIAGVVGGTGVGVAASTVAKSFGKMKVNPSDPASIRKLAAMAEAPSDTRSLWQKAQQVLSSARGKYIGMSDTLRKLQRDVYAPHGLPVVEGSTSDLATAFDRVNAYSHHAAASTQEMTAIRDSFDGKELPYANSLITALRLEDYAKARLRNQAALDAKVAAAQGALLKAIDANKALRPAIKQAEKLKGQLRLAKDRLRRDPKNAALAARAATIEADYNTAAAMRDAAVSEAKKIYGARAAMRSAQDDYAKNYDKYRTGDITTQEALDLPNEMRAKIAAEFGPKGVAKFDAAVNKWRDVMRRNLENLRDSGLVSDNQFNAVVANNEFYAPFRFLQEELDRIESGINTEMGTSGPVIRAREGFTRKDAKLQNMFEAARANIYDARIRAAQNRFMRDRLEPLTRLDPTGQFIKRVDPGHRAPAGRTVVRYKDNGQTVALEVPTPVAESIAGPKYDPSFVVKLFQEGNMLARLGQTAGDVVFLATQAGFLDPMRAQTMSNYSVFGGRFGIKPMALAALPLHYASGLKSALKTNFLDLQDNLMSQAVKNDAISGSFFTSSDPRRFDLRQSLGESAKSVRSPSEMFDAVSGLITRSGQSLDQMTKLVGWQQALQQEKIRIPVSTTGGVTKFKEISLKDAITDPRANPDDVREAISRAAYEVSNFYGSPNFSKKMLGLQGASLVFTYIKAAVRGIETDARRALPLSDISSAMVGKPYDKARLSNSMKTWSKLAAFGAATGYVYSINMLPENRDDFEGIDKRERDRKIPIPLSKFTFDDGSTTVAPATTESMANFLGAKQEPYRTWSPRENKWVREYFMVPMQGPYTMLAKDLAEQTMRTESDNNPDFASVANEFAARHFPVNIDGDSFKERMVSIVSSAQPTMRLPAELMYNIDTFTQRPIITKNVEGSPELQFDPTRDPEFYRKAAQAVDAVLPDFAGDWQKSPQAIKQILESYVGSTRMLNTSVAREGSVQQNIPIIGQRVGVSGRPELGPKREIAQEAKRGAADEKTIEDNAVDAMIEEMNNPSSDPEKIRRFEEAISIVSKSERAKDRFKERMTSSQRNTSTEARMIASLGSKSAKVKYYSGILNQMGGDLEKFIPYATEMMQYGNDVASKEIMNEVIGSFVQQQAAGAR